VALVFGNKVHGNVPNSTSTAVTLTYSAGSVIIADVTANSGPVVSVVSTALGNFTIHATTAFGQSTERWVLIAGSAQISDTITVTQSASNFMTIDCYEWKGVNTSSPYDSGGPVIQTTAPQSITTHNAATAVIALFRNNSTASPTSGSGFTQISGANFQLTEYQILASIQTLSCTETTGTADVGGVILDALVQASATGPVLGKAAPNIFRPRQGPSRGLITPLSSIIAPSITAGPGTVPPTIFRPGQGPSRGLSTSRSTFIPAANSGVGASAGVGTAQAVGAATFDAVAASAGVGTVQAVGQGIANSTAASAGVGAAAAIGQGIDNSVAAASGVATVTGVGASTADSVASSAGIGTATGVSAATADSVAASSGVATVTGVGASTADAIASSAGIGAALGVGSSASAGSGDGLAVGSSIVLGVSASTADGVATSSGIGIALGVGAGGAPGPDVAAFQSRPFFSVVGGMRTIIPTPP
jgi:hypothetical protein